MTRTMVHPYLGYVVKCAEFDGFQHVEMATDGKTHSYQKTWCLRCGVDLWACAHCGCMISCCTNCGHAHAFECPWPL